MSKEHLSDHCWSKPDNADLLLSLVFLCQALEYPVATLLPLNLQVPG
jgi:hypothetical protein